jgi:hypothetical protein
MVNNRIDEAFLHDKKISVRLSTEEHARLMSEAAAHGCTLSQFVRNRIVGEKLISKIDSQIVRELRRQGGLLKHLSSTPNMLDSQKVSHLLDEIKRTILSISGENPQ